MYYFHRPSPNKQWKVTHLTTQPTHRIMAKNLSRHNMKLAHYNQKNHTSEAVTRYELLTKCKHKKLLPQKDKFKLKLAFLWAQTQLSRITRNPTAATQTINKRKGSGKRKARGREGERAHPRTPCVVGGEVWGFGEV